MPKSTQKTAGARGKPHNALTSEYTSFNELLAMIAAERRVALVGDQQRSMSRGERLLRLMLDRALQGKGREVTKLLQLMAKNPSVAATFRDEIVIVTSGALCNV